MTISVVSCKQLVGFATKLALVVQYHKPECPVDKWDYCVQDQGHNEGSKCQWMFVQKIFSELQNVLLPNFVCWCSITSQSHADFFVVVVVVFVVAIIGVKSEQGLIWSKYESFYYIFWTVDSVATKLGLMIHHQKPQCTMKKLDHCIQGQCQSEGSKC